MAKYATGKSKSSSLERQFINLWKEHFPNRQPIKEHRFHPTRKWRFDFAWTKQKIAVEIQGYGPGHTSPEGMANDYEKHNEAIRLGWRIIYLTGPMINEPAIKALYSLLFGTDPQIGPKRNIHASEKLRRFLERNNKEPFRG